jgi:hypothetical protein
MDLGDTYNGRMLFLVHLFYILATGLIDDMNSNEFIR